MASIIVTVGPKSIKPEILRNLLKAGAESFRINLKEFRKVLREFQMHFTGALLRLEPLRGD